MAKPLPFAQWLREMSPTRGCIEQSEEGAHERIYIAKVGGSHASGLFFYLSSATDTAWMCRGDQLGHWFQATTPVQPLPIEPAHMKAWAHHL